MPRFLSKLLLGTIAGLSLMALVLGMMERQVNPRRMLFIGAFLGAGTAAILEPFTGSSSSQPKNLTPIEALSQQLSRTDLSPEQALDLAEALGKLQSLPGGALSARDASSER